MTSQPPSDRHEHVEKSEEKEEEKRHEKGPEEKGWDEKWRRDPLSAAVWACVLIWAGAALLLSNMGLLRLWRPMHGWDLVFLGAGVIVLIEVAIRLLLPAYRRPIGGSVILAVVLLAIGLQGIMSWNLIWPVVLIAIGLLVLVRGFARRT